jgi:S-adenosylmethionine hydrolase
MHFITLTTDFGLSDWFVGTMKNVIGSLNPGASIIDITHGIPSGDIRAGAFALRSSYSFAPEGTIHVAIVDPGVGSDRQAIAVQTRRYTFVGPDNGLLSWAIAKEEVQAVHRLKNSEWFLQQVSRTFHGRDVFAPVAAHLSLGVPLHQLGPAQDRLVRLDWPVAVVTEGAIQGEILYIDRFGNAITSISLEHLEQLNAAPLTVVRQGRRLCPVRDFYQSVAVGKAVAVLGSTGLLEIAVNNGNAAHRLQLKVGDRIRVIHSKSSSPA